LLRAEPLPAARRRDALYRHGVDPAAVLLHPRLAHHPRRDHRAAGHPLGEEWSEDARDAAPPRGALDLSPLDVRLGHRCARLLFPLPLVPVGMSRQESLLAELRGYEPFDALESGNRQALIDLVGCGDAVFSRDHFAPGHVTASCYIIDGDGRLLL